MFVGRGRRDRVNLQPRVLVLELDERVVGLHRLLERVLRLPELVVKLRHAVERQLDAEQLQAAAPAAPGAVRRSVRSVKYPFVGT